MSDADDFLFGGGVPAAKFSEIGDSITGVVTDEPVKQQQTEFGTGKPLFWDDGKPKEQLVITLATNERDDEDDEGLRRVYVKGRMRDAVADAFRKAGITSVAQVKGGTLTITYSANGKPSQKGFNPPKLYTAEFTPVASGEWG